MRPIPFLSTALAALLITAAPMSPAMASQEVNVYSARKDHLIKPVFEAFTRQTGIKVNLLSAGEDQLLERLKTEGTNSPADVLITTDIAHLHRARVAGVLQPLASPVVKENIPAKYWDPNGYWVGLSARARVLFYAKDRVTPAELSTYEDLADAKWQDRICVRSSSSTYNQTLLASMIAAHGVDKAQGWAKGVVANLARKPQGGDRDQIAAVAAGLCDVAIANTYYYGGMQTSEKEDERDTASKVGIFFPNQQDRGAHMNVAGAGITASARNKAAGTALIEFLSGPEAQRLFAEANNEFPVAPSAKLSPTVAAWGSFKGDEINSAVLGENNAEAIRIFDRVGWR